MRATAATPPTTGAATHAIEDGEDDESVASGRAEEVEKGLLGLVVVVGKGKGRPVEEVGGGCWKGIPEEEESWRGFEAGDVVGDAAGGGAKGLDVVGCWTAVEGSGAGAAAASVVPPGGVKKMAPLPAPGVTADEEEGAGRATLVAGAGAGAGTAELEAAGGGSLLTGSGMAAAATTIAESVRRSAPTVLELDTAVLR